METPTATDHEPVLLDRVVALLGPAVEERAAVVVDATVGLGGHAEALLRRYPRLELIGLDRDPQAIARSTKRLAAYTERLTLVHAVYDELPSVLADHGRSAVDGVLFDLGASSAQLDEPVRGFSYSRDAALDMRMDPTVGRDAAEVVNGYTAAELARVLHRYGEERFARRIADAIVGERRRTPLTSTAQLAQVVRSAVPAATRRTGGHPAKRTFQALRIEVNGELDALARALPAAIASLAGGGRIVALSYHSGGPVGKADSRRCREAFRAARPSGRARGCGAPVAAAHPRR
jgi:16S rRNA (cytosine1402-N4)-methyltransferase